MIVHCGKPHNCALTTRPSHRRFNLEAFSLLGAPPAVALEVVLEVVLADPPLRGNAARRHMTLAAVRFDGECRTAADNKGR